MYDSHVNWCLGLKPRRPQRFGAGGPRYQFNTQETDPVKRLGKPKISRVYSPLSFRQIFEFIIFVLISFLPIAGLPIFLVLTGYRAGPLQHWRYFKLLKLTRKEREKKMKDRWWRYTK